MKPFGIFLLILGLTASPASMASKIFKLTESLYYEEVMVKKHPFGWKGLVYWADTQAEICVVQSMIGGVSGTTSLPCSSLAKRPGWEKIIIWE